MNSRLDVIQDWLKVLSDNGYSIRHTASACKVTIRQLERYFAETRCCTPHDYIRTVRLEAAFRLLAEGKPIKEISFALGYRSVSHFSAAFKQSTGQTPRGWRFHTHAARAKMSG